MPNMGIYEIKNKTNEKIYIGSSCNLKQRLRDHKNRLKNNTHCNNHLQSAWNKHGEDCFEYRILQIVDNRDNLLDIEQQWLDKTKCYDDSKGYNIAKFTDSNFRRLLEEDILKVANLHREGKHYKKIAKDTGLSLGTIHEIRNGNIYSDITELPKVQYQLSELGEKDVIYISKVCKDAICNDENLTQVIIRLSEEFNVTKDIIYCINSGKTWSDITGNKHISQKKLTSADMILDIHRDIISGLSNKSVSSKHDITTRYVARIKSGEIWSNITGIKYKRRHLTEQEVIDIYTRKYLGEKTELLAKEFEVSGATIDRIKNKKIWKSITDQII